MVDIERSATEGVAGVVRKILKEQLDGLRLVSVEVGEGYDAGGDPVLDVVVVYDPEGPDPDISKVVSFVRHLRPALSEIGEERFPVMSYVPSDEHVATA